KPEPSVFTAYSLPPPTGGWGSTVRRFNGFTSPYRVLPDKINPPDGPPPQPSLALYRIVKVCAVTGTADMMPRAAIRVGRGNRFLMDVFMVLHLEKQRFQCLGMVQVVPNSRI